MRRTELVEWGQRHVETLLTVLALALVLGTAVPAGDGSTGWHLVLAGVTWLPLTVRTRWPLPVAAVAVLLDTLRIVAVAHANANANGSTLPVATMLALYTVGTRCTARVTWTAAVIAALTQYVTGLIAFSGRPGNDLLYLNW